MIAEKDEIKYQISLSLIEEWIDVIGKKSLAHCGSAKAVFLTSKDNLASISGVGRILIKSHQAILLESDKDIIKGLH